jgi:hypothetical protein
MRFVPPHDQTLAAAFKAAAITFLTAWLIPGKRVCKAGTSQGAARIRLVPNSRKTPPDRQSRLHRPVDPPSLTDCASRLFGSRSVSRSRASAATASASGRSAGWRSFIAPSAAKRLRNPSRPRISIRPLSRAWRPPSREARLWSHRKICEALSRDAGRDERAPARNAIFPPPLGERACLGLDPRGGATPVMSFGASLDGEGGKPGLSAGIAGWGGGSRIDPHPARFARRPPHEGGGRARA